MAKNSQSTALTSIEISNKIEELKSFERNKVVTSTTITNARTKMTATELKVFYRIATLIKMGDDDFKRYSMPIKTFADELNINNTNRDFLIKTCRNLLKQTFELWQDEHTGEWEAYTIFSSFKYSHKEQKIYFGFNEAMKPYLLELKQRFTAIQNIQYIKSFESKYSIRIYALLKDYRKMAQRDFDIAELAKMFQLPPSYENYARLYIKVLKPAIDEINEKSDLWISEPEIIGKVRKKITHIRFYFGNKADKIADDIKKAIMNYYKATKDINAFVGFEYMPKNEYDKFLEKNKFQQPKVYKILEINLKSFELLTELKNNKLVQHTFTNSNESKPDFIKNIVNGIYNAVNYKYEMDKKEQLPLELWQNEKEEKEARIQFAKNFLESLKAKSI